MQANNKTCKEPKGNQTTERYDHHIKINVVYTDQLKETLDKIMNDLFSR